MSNTTPKHQSVSLPVPLSHPGRVLYAAQGITKQALAEYYVRVAKWMLPHVQGRTLTLVRCPQGQGRSCFYQKHMTKGMPQSLKPVAILEKRKTSDYITIDDSAGLVSLVQIGALEIHAWGARRDRPERPDQLVFDLDPGPDVEWSQVIEAAHFIRVCLEELGLLCFVKTTGSRGLHVTLPIARRTDWETAKAFCKAIAEIVCRRQPEKFVCNMSKAKRRGRIFVDYLRNGRGATSVCPFSMRALASAPVSAPVSWQELSHVGGANYYTVENVPERLAALEQDPWPGYFGLRQGLDKRMLSAVGV